MDGEMSVRGGVRPPRTPISPKFLHEPVNNQVRERNTHQIIGGFYYGKRF